MCFSFHAQPRPHTRPSDTGLIEAILRKDWCGRTPGLPTTRKRKICAATIQNDNLISCFGHHRSINYIRLYYVSGSEAGGGKGQSLFSLSLFFLLLLLLRMVRGECDPVNSKMKQEVVHAIQHEVRTSKVSEFRGRFVQCASTDLRINRRLLKQC